MRWRFWTCIREPPPFRPFQSIENWKYSPIFHGTGGSPAVSGLARVSGCVELAVGVAPVVVGAARAVGSAPAACSALTATGAAAGGDGGKESGVTEEAAGNAISRKMSSPRTMAAARPRVPIRYPILS